MYSSNSNSTNHLISTHTQSNYGSLPTNIDNNTNILSSNNRNQISDQQQQQQISHLQNVNPDTFTHNNENQMVECNYKNCSVNKSSCCNKIPSSGSPKIPTQHHQQQSNAQHQKLAQDCYGGNIQYNNNSDNLYKNVTSRDDHKVTTILPPPLFDENINNHGNSGEQSKYSSRRHHRSIPRHFTTSVSQAVPTAAPHKSSHKNLSDTPKKSSSRSSSHNNTPKNAKPICQCPVQHVPMTYMGSKHFNSTRSQQNEIFLSTLSAKLTNQKQNYVAKATSGSTSKQQTHSSHSKDSGISSIGCSSSATTTGGNVSSTDVSQSSTLRRSKPSNKIPTISKQIVTNETQQQQQYVRSNQAHIHSILKHSQVNTNQSRQKIDNKYTVAASATAIKTNDITLNAKNITTTTTTSTLPLHLIESVNKNSENPILPPKMYKSYNNITTINSNQITTISNTPTNTTSAASTTSKIQHQQQQPRIHTISKSNDNFLLAHNSTTKTSAATTRTTFMATNQQLSHTKSLPRATDDKLTFLQPISGFNNVEKSYSLGKINYTQSFPKLTNHYTLPKASNGKISLISDVVSKVPSVVNIPSPINMMPPSSIPKSPILSTTSILTMTPTSAIHSPIKQDDIPIVTVPLSSTVTKVTSEPQSSSSSAVPLLLNGKTVATIAKMPIVIMSKIDDKQQPLPVCTTYKNCSNPKEHFLPNDTSLDDEYLSECENCKSAHGSRYYLDEPIEEQPQETMTLQRKMDDKQEDEQAYYRTSSTLPSNTKQKNA